MLQNKSKILVLYTGGTFGMQKHPVKKSLYHLSTLSSKKLKKNLFENIPELKKIAQCDVKIIFNRDSSHMGPEQWITLAKVIRKNWSKYSGVVVLHGTDTLSYTASALSYLLPKPKVPVVLTGAQRPLSEVRSDARQNFISSIEIVSKAPRPFGNEVMVFFHDVLLLGTKARKKSITSFDAFESSRYPVLANIGRDIEYTKSFYSIKKVGKIKKCMDSFSGSVVVCPVSPHFPVSVYCDSFLKSIDALILSVYPSGTSPTHKPEFREWIKKLKKMKIPFIIVTEHFVGGEDQVSYESASYLIKEGGLWAGMLTPECAFVKTCFILGQKDGKSKFKKYWSGLPD